MGLQRRLGEFRGSTPIVKRFSAEIFLSPVKSGPKMAVFSGIRGLNVNFLFSNPEKANLFARNRVVWCIMRENRFGGLGCEALVEPPKAE